MSLEQVLKESMRNGTEDLSKSISAYKSREYESALSLVTRSINNYDAAFNAISEREYRLKHLREKKQKAYCLRGKILEKLGRKREAEDCQTLANEITFTNGEMVKEVYGLISAKHYTSAVDVCKVMYKKTGSWKYLEPLAEAYELMGKNTLAAKVRAILRAQHEVRI